MDTIIIIIVVKLEMCVRPNNDNDRSSSSASQEREGEISRFLLVLRERAVEACGAVLELYKMTLKIFFIISEFSFEVFTISVKIPFLR